MSYEQFARLFVQLSIRLRSLDGNVPNAMAYFTALDTLEVELVEEAAKRLALTSKRFPTTAEWHKEAMAVAREWRQRLDQIKTQRARVGAFLCAECEDVGRRRRAGTDRYELCPCQELRRLEMLGRRPMPLLPAKAES